jgi:hypothetical protein
MDGCREEQMSIVVRNRKDGSSLGGRLLLPFSGFPSDELFIAGPA